LPTFWPRANIYQKDYLSSSTSRHYQAAGFVAAG
jgi:hypothetical protein